MAALFLAKCHAKKNSNNLRWIIETQIWTFINSVSLKFIMTWLEQDDIHYLRKPTKTNLSKIVMYGKTVFSNVATDKSWHDAGEVW